MQRDVLELTAAGNRELLARELGLSLPQRWLLVRVNGKDSLAALAQASVQPDALQRLPTDAQRLVQKGLVRWVDDGPAAAALPVPAILDTAPRGAPGPGWLPAEPVAEPSADAAAAPDGSFAAAKPGPVRRAVQPRAIAAAVVVSLALGLGLWVWLDGSPPPVDASPATSNAGSTAVASEPRPEPTTRAVAAPTVTASAEPLAAAATTAQATSTPVPLPLPPKPTPGAAPAPAPAPGPGPGPAPGPAPAPAPAPAAPLAVALAPIATAAPMPLPAVTALARPADLPAVAPALSLPLPAAVPSGPLAAAAITPAPPAAQPANNPGPLRPVFSPRPRLPSEWQEDSRALVQLNATMAIDASGAVSRVTFSNVTPADAALVRVSRQSLLRWRFAEGAPGRTYNVELVFRAE